MLNVAFAANMSEQLLSAGSTFAAVANICRQTEINDSAAAANCLAGGGG
jgi:hypothetical protein